MYTIDLLCVSANKAVFELNSHRINKAIKKNVI